MINKFITEGQENIETSLMEEIEIYTEAFKNYKPNFLHVINGNIVSMAKLEFMLAYYNSMVEQNDETAVKVGEVKKILDDYTTVNYVGEKRYDNRGGAFFYKFTKVSLTEDIRADVDKMYDDCCENQKFKLCSCVEKEF